MGDRADGDLHAEFEQRLDHLLADLCPEWRPPEPYRGDERFRAYSRVNAKRRQVGDLLKARPDLAVAVVERVLATIACDEDVAYNKQLIYPLLDAVGRRPVQRYLISVVETGPAPKKVCAVRAWYWSQVTLVYTSMEALHEASPTEDSRTADDEVVDLRGRYRAACLAAFVACDHVPTREWLARGFVLNEDFYPPNTRELVAKARAIAAEDPARYGNLRTKHDDGTNMAEVNLDRSASGL